ncbi:MAG TPA: hypothetical protein VL426_04195 [Candidatus Binatia bacterium]|jgi:hypothetical protein|nr:hypothetical protein [Candidatus Binatia bacterium]
MRIAKNMPFLAALLLLGAGCLPTGPAIPSVERIPFPSSGAPVNLSAGPTPKVEPSLVPETTSASGVRGVVLIGPNCAAKKAPDDGSCADKPYAADLRIATKNGTPVKKFSSGADGRFAVGLIPGTYVIGQPPTAPSMPSAQDQTFTVAEGAWTDVTLHFDTGIR